LQAAGITGPARVLLADAGYCSEDNLEQVAGLPMQVLVATGRVAHGDSVLDADGGRVVDDVTRRQQMAARLRAPQGRGDYARRKAIVEPVFGQMKVRQNAGRARLRGLEGVTGEFTLHAVVHNLRKLANTGVRACAIRT